MARTIRLTALVLCSLLALTLWMSQTASAQQGSDPQTLQLGAELYAQNCLVCHGEQGAGRVGATLSKNWPSIRPDLTIKNVISNGVAGSPMPAWSEEKGGPLNATQIDALVAYILTWESGEPFQFQTPAPIARPAITPPANVQGDPNRGARLFDENCAVCHGPNGEGRIGAKLAKDWPSIRPDLNVENVINNGVSGSVMPAWSQANGGPLGESDVADLTAFILSLPHAQAVQQPAPTSSAFSSSPASNAIAVTLAIVLFVILIGAILLAQRKK